MFDDFEDMMESLRKDWRESAAQQKQKWKELAGQQEQQWKEWSAQGERRLQESFEQLWKDMEDSVLKLQKRHQKFYQQREAMQSKKISVKFEKIAVREETSSTTDATTSSVIPIKDTNINLLTNATITGPSSTIFPTNQSTENNNNNNLECFNCEVEELSPNSFDNDFVNAENDQFADPVGDSICSGICSTSVLLHSCELTILQVPTSSSVYNLASVNDSKFTQLTYSSKIFAKFSNPFLLHYNHDNILFIYFINRYRIFIWDPGISLYYVFIFNFTSQ